MVTGVGAVVAAFAAVEEDEDGAGAEPVYRVETEKSCGYKICINKKCLSKMNMELNTHRYVVVTHSSSENYSSL
jgi:hypothetical protein